MKSRIQSFNLKCWVLWIRSGFKQYRTKSNFRQDSNLKQIICFSPTTPPQLCFSSTTAPKLCFLLTTAPQVCFSSTTAPKLCFSSTTAPQLCFSSTTAPQLCFYSTTAPQLCLSSTTTSQLCLFSTTAPKLCFSSTTASQLCFFLNMSVLKILVHEKRSMCCAQLGYPCNIIFFKEIENEKTSWILFMIFVYLFTIALTIFISRSLHIPLAASG